MRFLASVAVLSLALATSVSAQPIPEQPTAQPASTAAPAPASTEGADKKKDGVVCRKEMPTGSHFPVKVCTTSEQRKAERSAAQRAQENAQIPRNDVIPN